MRIQRRVIGLLIASDVGNAVFLDQCLVSELTANFQTDIKAFTLHANYDGNAVYEQTQVSKDFKAYCFP